MRGRLALGARLLGAASRIAADRLDEARGLALPRTPEQLARPEALNALLRDGAPTRPPPLPAVRGARLPGIDFESSNCRNFLVELAFDPGAQAPEPLPTSFYAKLPGAAFATRLFAHAVGFWRTEVTFCARVAPRVPIRVPRVYAASYRGARFALLLENVQALPGARLFVNRDMAAGTTPERARTCIEMFALLHVAFWDLDAPRRERLLPMRLHPFLGPGARERNRALNALAIEPAHRAEPEVFTRRHVALCRLAIEKWDALLAHWYSAPLTLIHGDSHLANCFEYATPEGPRMGMLDFQGAQWCHGLRDVQYFLIDSLEPSRLAACEDELIGAYVEALAAQGVALDMAEARERYRALVLQTLMVAVVSLGLGALPERAETLRTVLARAVAASERLELAHWLERL
jgi:hypothetical protein